MTKKKISGKIEIILSEITGENQSIDIDNFEQIDNFIEYYYLESMQFMEFITALESEFETEFPEDITFDELNSVSYLINYLIDNATHNTPLSEKQ